MKVSLTSDPSIVLYETFKYNSEAEMTHEELLKKYNVNATEFNEQKEEIANIFLKELANMQQAEAEGPGFKSCLTGPIGS